MTCKGNKMRRRHFTSGTKERRKIMSCRLSKQLREQYGIRSMPVTRGDQIIMMRGSSVDKEATITSVYRKKLKVYCDKITRKNASGTEKAIALEPSNMMITKLNLTMSRKKVIERKGKKVKSN